MQFAAPVAIDTTVLTVSNVPETETLWSAATTYALNAAVYLVEGGIHYRYVSLAGANLNKPPATQPTWWRAEGATNRWAMFDDASNSPTTQAVSISVVMSLPATERIDVLYLQGLDARTVRVLVTDPLAGAVYDETFGLSDPAGITDWHAWFFAAVDYKSELLVTDLPSGAGSTLSVIISHPTGTAACNNLITGFRRSLGDTAWGVKTEIRDYSVFADNDFGDRVIVQRAYRKLASCRVILDNRVKDAVERLLTNSRATVALYIANEDYTTLAVLGLARWSVEMSLPPDRSLCSLEIESTAT